MFIKEVDLFHGLPSHVIDEIAALATEGVFPAGSVLFERGESAEFFYVMEEGAVELTFGEEGHTCFSIDRTGDLFGWSALIEPSEYTSSATCVRESKLVNIDGNRLMHIFERHPVEGLRGMRRLGGIIASRLVRNYQQVRASLSETKVPSYG